MTFKVAEKFVSINGEGRRAGQAAVFIRLAGCNLSCSYCDTKWANDPCVPVTPMTEKEISGFVLDTEIKNVTLTGGEPLLAEGVGILLEELSRHGLRTEVETNGSISIRELSGLYPAVSFTVDYKLPDSGMENKMCLENFESISHNDTVKFVAGSSGDLERALFIMEKYKLPDRCAVYISPVFGRLEPVKIAEFITENRLNNVNLQLQLHKFIWDPDRRGV